MSPRVFFDSNVLLYTLAENDPREGVATRLVSQGGYVSVQVLNEFASVARRKLRMSWADVERSLAALRQLCSPPLALTLSTHSAAFVLAARYSFSFYDALIVASALEAGCGTVWSEDMQDGLAVEGRLLIRNPFRAA